MTSAINAANFVLTLSREELARDADDLAPLIVRETGKRHPEAMAEVEMSAAYFDWFASVAERLEHEWTDDRAQVHRVPVGVVAAITAWNFPLSLPARKLAAAFAAGCPVVLKPSPLSPLSAIALTRACDRHLPAGCVGVVLGGRDQAHELVDSDHVRAASFTGSTEVGVGLATRLGATLKRGVLELGGRAPFVILPGANVGRAVDHLMVAKFRNNGSSCIAANNVFVHESLVDEVWESVVARVSSMVTGDPFDPESDLGPLRTDELADSVRALADIAVRDGGESAVGTAMSGGTRNVPATAVRVRSDSASWAAEVFGPLLLLRGFDSPEEVSREVNGWRRGLGGYVAGRSRQEASSFASRLRVGMIGIDTGSPNAPRLPFGGFDEAGWGREGSALGVDPFLETRTLSFGSGVAPTVGEARS
ncbi:aldehyde dehydrogenase family protein [Nocardioides bruguierae]|uniref:Aldehyde dehydrogenase family protein n=1 Tax=Nocardioides bruguierae TaxID=2945102 RepID=A0A9X2DB45_9ACTN|nr:aldehyde dehydrogenase family protein [Nocardioides bruguierae]MCM0621359.1 aldehyde dehydrogenase family protein [Nocardioides bruguierae]